MKAKQVKKNGCDGWLIIKLGDLAVISRGGSPRPIESYITDDKNGLNWLRIGDIKLGAKYVYGTSQKIKKEGLSKTTLVESGDFILSNSMSFGRPYIMKISACIHDGWLALRKIKTDLVSKEFLYYLLSSKKIQNDFVSISAGSGVQNLKKDTVSTVAVKIPLVDEQNSIVAVLETWDEAIEKLTKKIEIKKAIKKGLMQELLKGKTRLSGFKDKWEVKKLGDVCDIGTGSKNNQDKISNGVYPFYVRSPIIERINSYSYDGEAILIPGEGNIGKIFHYINGRFDFHQRVYKISDFKLNVLGKYLYYYLVKHFSKATKSDSVKATVDSLRLPTFTKFQVQIPALAEQKAIVEILDVANEEVKKLQKQLTILKDQKKFLLNNLITGAIRTPEKFSIKTTKR
jgi:type I restriction enzyme S subunit